MGVARMIRNETERKEIIVEKGVDYRGDRTGWLLFGRTAFGERI